jgi:multidrug resistance protein
LAVGSLDIAKEFHLTDAYSPTFPVAFFVLGFGLGPLYLAPLSELYGRRIIYLSCFGFFTIFNIGCALAPSIVGLSILRFLAGMAGSVAASMGGGSIGDMFTPEKRGRAQSVYAFGPTGGSALGGVIGGFILQGTGNWRWQCWIMAIAAGATSLLSVLFLDETYEPHLLRSKAAALRKATGYGRYRSDFDEILSARRLFFHTITRTLRMLFTSPICSAMSIYMGM